MVVQFRRRMQILTMPVASKRVFRIVVNRRAWINSDVVAFIVWMRKVALADDWLPPKTFENGLKLNSIQMTAHKGLPGSYASIRAHEPGETILAICSITFNKGQVKSMLKSGNAADTSLKKSGAVMAGGSGDGRNSCLSLRLKNPKLFNAPGRCRCPRGTNRVHTGVPTETPRIKTA